VSDCTVSCARALAARRIAAPRAAAGPGVSFVAELEHALLEVGQWRHAGGAARRTDDTAATVADWRARTPQLAPPPQI
jgi:hypothetical protein